jgi:hypothetical protein
LLRVGFLRSLVLPNRSNPYFPSSSIVEPRCQTKSKLIQLKRKALVLESENERLSKKVGELLRENLQLKGMAPQQLQGALVELDKYLARIRSDDTDTKRPSSDV